MEILWTGLDSFRRRDFKLTGHSSLWMFPIYGCAAFIGPVSRLLRKKNLLFRGNLYMLGIFLVEFFTGSLLRRKTGAPGIMAMLLKHPRRHPTGLCAFMAARRALFRTCTELHEKRGQSPSFRIRNLTASHTPEPVIKQKNPLPVFFSRNQRILLSS